MSKKDTKRSTPQQRPTLPRRDPKELQTIAALKRMIKRMQTAGLIFILAGAFMPKYSPYYAEKSWKMLIGVTLTDSLLMRPGKSVTAIVGILENKRGQTYDPA